MQEWVRENLYAEDPEGYVASLLKRDSLTLQSIVKDLVAERMEDIDKPLSNIQTCPQSKTTE